MPTLYDYLDSGNGYKIRLLLSLLDRPYRWQDRSAGLPCSLFS